MLFQLQKLPPTLLPIINRPVSVMSIPGITKKENGKLYKRLYNNSVGRWESDWIFIKHL